MPSLRRLRLEAGLTQQSLAERAGVTKQTVWELETGRRAARPDTMRRIADVLRVPIGDVIEFAAVLEGERGNQDPAGGAA